MSQELFFREKALDSVFSRLDSDFKRKIELGEEIWARGFDLLNLFGERAESLRQEKGQTVALACRSLSLRGGNLIIKTSFFRDSEKPKMFFGEEGIKAIIVVPPEGMPWVIPREIGEIDRNDGVQEIKYHIGEEGLMEILNFLKGVTLGKKEEIGGRKEKE